MKKNKLTFAQRASKINKKYTRKDFDPIEKADYEKEMDSLIEEQENYKSANNIGNDSNKFKLGGPTDDRSDTEGLSYINPISVNSVGDNSLDTTTLATESPNYNSNSNWLSGATPSLISGGVGILNDVLKSSLDKKPTKLAASTYNPQLVSFDDARDSLDRNYDEANAQNRSYIRNNARSGSQAMSNLLTGSAELYGKKSDSITNLDTKEQQLNANAINQASQYNASNVQRANELNLNNNQLWKQRQLGYLNDAMGIIPSAISDINNIHQQDTENNLKKQKYNNMLKALSAMGNYNVSSNGTISLKS